VSNLAIGSAVRYQHVWHLAYGLLLLQQSVSGHYMECRWMNRDPRCTAVFSGLGRWEFVTQGCANTSEHTRLWGVRHRSLLDALIFLPGYHCWPEP